MQKRGAVWIIPNIHRLTQTNELFKSLKLLKFTELVEYKTRIIIYTAFNDRLLVRLRALFSIGNELKCITRQNNKFRI